jgi:ribosomal-protein-alanine N-acetyltransferase
MPVFLEVPGTKREAEFLAAVRRSRSLHQGLVSPQCTPKQYRAYLTRLKQPIHLGYFVCLPSAELAGVINLNEIVRGAFKSAYLGYYAFAPHHGSGNMAAGLRLVLGRAFKA